MAQMQYVRTVKLIELIRRADPKGDAYAQVSDNKIVVGVDPTKPDLEIDLASEEVRPRGGYKFVEANASTPAPKATRVMGFEWFQLDGKRIECQSKKQLLLSALQALEKRVPGTLEKLSNQKNRTKRIVARNRNDLFSKKHLVEDHSDQIVDGWWVGTNNSSAEAKVWLKRAVEKAGLVWGKDFDCSL